MSFGLLQSGIHSNGYHCPSVFGTATGEEVSARMEGKKTQGSSSEPTQPVCAGCLATPYQGSARKLTVPHHRWWIYRKCPCMFADDLAKRLRKAKFQSFHWGP